MEPVRKTRRRSHTETPASRNLPAFLAGAQAIIHFARFAKRKAQNHGSARFAHILRAGRAPHFLLRANAG